jgi:hypothetical protein
MEDSSMGKKAKQAQAKKQRRGKGRPWITGAAVAMIVGAVAWGWIGTRGPRRIPNEAFTPESGYARRETRVPLSPALFVGQTARAYKIAHEIPEVLDQLYCYCECDKHLSHRSLLSCFIDSHAAT